MKLKKEVTNYLIFGILTTIINIVSYQLLNFLLGEKLYLVNNIICWVIAVSFAFVTNKLWVFESKCWSGKTVLPQLVSFLTARLFSLLLEEIGLFLMIDVITLNGFVAKVIIQIIVVVTNYIFSKFLIFKKNI